MEVYIAQLVKCFPAIHKALPSLVPSTTETTGTAGTELSSQNSGGRGGGIRNATSQHERKDEALF